MTRTRLRHPDVEKEILVPTQSTGNYVTAGWQVVEENIHPGEPPPVEPAPTGMARIKHPALDNREMTVPAVSVSNYELSGWQLVKEDVPESTSPPPPENPEVPVAVDPETAPQQPKGKREK